MGQKCSSLQQRHKINKMNSLKWRTWEIQFVIKNPDRSNIEFLVKEGSASTNTLDDVDVLLEDCWQGSAGKEKDISVVIYMDTAVISYSNMFKADLIGKQQYIGNDCPENRPFSQHHQQDTERMKKFIVSEICKDSTIRSVFATVCLCMGLNAPNIRHVIARFITKFISFIQVVSGPV